MFLKWTVILSILAIFARTAMSIMCYQCKSTDTDNPYQCAEFMNGDEDIKPTPCTDVYGAKYCIKFTGRHEGGWETIRSCSSLDHGNYCIYGSQPGDQLDYRSCMYTCSTDGCNAANKSKFCFLIMLIPVALLTKMYL
ncbi:U-scoloptoxin(05)-Sm1a [Ischnura elegans]|uniref:U-scoloptoxin(05)-Sm1a n=1 Tax=Ischnura elegans TaxID=197161 RepID=UPI001ED8A678|nr:U-scoloptoxin(05)-Sm1a [Ischnura elegans]